MEEQIFKDVHNYTKYKLIEMLINKHQSKFKNLNDINFSMNKNGSLVQKGNTSQMMWNFDELISEIQEREVINDTR